MGKFFARRVGECWINRTQSITLAETLSTVAGLRLSPEKAHMVGHVGDTRPSGEKKIRAQQPLIPLIRRLLTQNARHPSIKVLYNKKSISPT